jgi:hypothetical protein
MVSRMYVCTQKVKCTHPKKMNCVSLSNSQDIYVGSKICKLNAYVPHCNMLMCYSGHVVSYFVLGFLCIHDQNVGRKRRERKRYLLQRDEEGRDKARVFATGHAKTWCRCNACL